MYEICLYRFMFVRIVLDVFILFGFAIWKVFCFLVITPMVARVYSLVADSRQVLPMVAMCLKDVTRKQAGRQAGRQMQLSCK